MPLPFRPTCQPTSLGPLPHGTAPAAWEALLRATPALPALPLLVHEGESLPLMSAEGFAGVVLSNLELLLDRPAATQGLGELYAAYLKGAGPRQSVDLAALPRLLPAEQAQFRRARMIFGLVLGPISLGLTLVDEQAEPLVNDRELLDGLAQHVFLRRLWLHKMLERMGKPAAIWLYEPYLDVLALPFCPQECETLIEAVNLALGYGMPRALWLPDAETAVTVGAALPLDLLGMPLPVPEQAPLLGPVLKQLLVARTALAWGIVPVTAEGLRTATVGRLAARFEVWLRALAAAGVPPTDVLVASLVMPEDTLAYLEPAEAERALALTAELSSLIRQSYGVE